MDIRSIALKALREWKPAFYAVTGVYLFYCFFAIFAEPERVLLVSLLFFGWMLPLIFIIGFVIVYCKISSPDSHIKIIRIIGITSFILGFVAIATLFPLKGEPTWLAKGIVGSIFGFTAGLSYWLRFRPKEKATERNQS
jgi:hypothetical protein